MSTTENGSKSLLIVSQKDTPSFIENEIPLKKLAKKLEKLTPAALDVLEKLLTSADEKVQLQAAMKLLDYEIDVKKAISQDQMQRLIAEIKLKGNPAGKLVPLEDENNSRPARPKVDFTTIQEI